MEKQFAGFAAGKHFKNVAAKRAKIFKPGAEVFRELFVDFAAQALGKCRTLTGGGDGNLQIAAADHRAEEEIAIGDVVDTVAENAALERSLIDGCIDLRRVGGGDDQQIAFEVGKFKCTRKPFKFFFDGQLADFRMRVRCDDA